jgi:hypothetical protein
LIEGEQEIAEIADAVRSSMPMYATSFELVVWLLAGRVWRLRRAYRYVAETSPGERSKAFEETLNALENVVSRSAARLGLDPVSAAELGVNLQRLAAGGEDPQRQFDWSSLDSEERVELDRLIRKGRADGDD